jgi:hypothetical protein
MNSVKSRLGEQGQRHSGFVTLLDDLLLHQVHRCEVSSPPIEVSIEGTLDVKRNFVAESIPLANSISRLLMQLNGIGLLSDRSRAHTHSGGPPRSA